MRVLLPLGCLFAFILLSPVAQRTSLSLTTPCSPDPMPVYRPHLWRVERMPILRPDTLKIEKMPILRALCATDLGLTPKDTGHGLSRLLPRDWPIPNEGR